MNRGLLVPRLFGLFVGAVAPCHSFMYLQSRWCRVGKKTNISLFHASQKDSCMAEAATVFQIDPIFVFQNDPIFVFQNDPPPGTGLCQPHHCGLMNTLNRCKIRIVTSFFFFFLWPTGLAEERTPCKFTIRGGHS